MSDIETLKKLVDEKDIGFIKANEDQYYNMYADFININSKPYVIGVDLANGPDRTGYIPPIKS